MNQNNPSLKPTEWHRRPKNHSGRCPICGFPAQHGRIEHRAADADSWCKWITRRKTPTGWREETIDRAGKPVRPPAMKPEPAPPTTIEWIDEFGVRRVTERRPDLPHGVWIDEFGEHWLSKHAAIERFLIPGKKFRPWRERSCGHLGGRTILWCRRPVHYLRRTYVVPVYAEKDLEAIAVARANPVAPRPVAPPAIEPTPSFVPEIVALVAGGHTPRDACETAGLSYLTFARWRQYRKNQRLYQLLLNEEMEKSVAAVRVAAGTDAVLDDVDGFLLRARAAERWCAAKGEALIEAKGQTLRTFYDQYYEPVCLAGVSTAAKVTFLTTIRKWVYLTGDPPLTEVSNITLANFKKALMKCRGQQPHLPMRSASVARHLKHLQAVLDKAGPADRHNRDAAGILERVPWVKPPRVRLAVPQTVAEALIEQIYTAAVGMDQPRLPGIRPAAWWQALIVVAYNTGIRRRTLFQLRMTDIDWAGSRLVIPPERMKSGRGLIVHLNHTVLEHLRRIRTKRDLVFEWPFESRSFDRYSHKLQHLAGIPTKSHFGLQGFRRTLATLLWRDNPEAARLTLGHAGANVTIGHYVAAEKIVAAALDKLRQPPAFTNRL
ncbi:MAG TPA: tyrosine-type recombinase/integrase [Thermoguttaceae bacterium]|nr:tyrosine-type recombinase/integrase [Thermoguttaceae bacterium]